MKARLIKAAFLEDERLCVVPFQERFFLLGLLHLADRDGKLEDRPMKIKALSMPYDDADGNEMLNTLLGAGLILRNGGFIKIVHWEDWVSPFPKETESLIPDDIFCSTGVEQSSYQVATGKLPTSYGVATTKHNKVISKSSNKREQRRTTKLAPYPKEVVSFVEALASEWPTKRKDGSKVESDIVKTVSRVNSILNDNPDITIADLGAAARSWIKTSPNWPNAMEFWFGPGKGQEPPWRIEVQAKMTLDQLYATEQEQAANDF